MHGLVSAAFGFAAVNPGHPVSLDEMHRRSLREHR
jgi:hypothetical protein